MENNKKKKDILLIGDSLTDLYQENNGWGEKIEDWYIDKANVINKGYSCHTSEMIKNMLPTIIPNKKNEKLLWCSILLGTNDCYYVGREVSPKQYKENILSIIDYIHNINPVAVIILITPPTTSDAPDKIKDYVKKIYDIKKRRPYICLIDLYNGPNKITAKDLKDGIHFNETGSNKLFEYIKSSLTSCIARVTPLKI